MAKRLSYFKLGLLFLFSLLLNNQVEAATSEAFPLVIKGSQSIIFKTRSFSGSKEGYVAGSTQSREETLRLSVAGKSGETEIKATVYRTTAVGVTKVGALEEKISILLRRGSTEAYLGDFYAGLTETEFTALNKYLSGARLKGDYQNWGFVALYSSPKGKAKVSRFYGDGTQGPYSLTYSPLVINSDKVYLNGILQVRGDDYTIDYNTGQITFKKKTIDRQSIIVVNYDYSQTTYKHSTYALRGYLKPLSNLKLGLTYLNDSDSLTGAQAIRDSMSSNPVEPYSHSIIGTDLKFKSANYSLNGELAYSDKNLNLLSSAGTRELGSAQKLVVTSKQGPFKISGNYKRVEPNFQKILEADPRQDWEQYGGSLSFRPGRLFSSRLKYNYQKYKRSSILYQESNQSFKAQLLPQKLPSLQYSYSQQDESNDPVTGSKISRTIKKNVLHSQHQIGFFAASLKGSLSNWQNNYPSRETTNYQRINLGLATIGINKITFASNFELENRSNSLSGEAQRKTYTLKLSTKPSRQYFLTSNLQVIDDSSLGYTSVLDLSYKAKPNRSFSTNGKYQIESLAETFGLSQETVAKHTASLAFDYRPIKLLRLRYLYRPVFTQVARNSVMSYKNEQQRAQINLLPTKQLLLGYVYKINNSFVVNKYDYPNYGSKNSIGNGDYKLYTIKYAPFRSWSSEFNYLIDKAQTKTLTATTEPFTYRKQQGKALKFDASLKTSQVAKFSLTARYTYQRTYLGSQESLTDITDSLSHTGSLQGTWRPTVAWNFSASLAYTQTRDYRLSRTTYTYSPGCGFIYRRDKVWRLDFDYTYAKSALGATTEKSTYSLRSQYFLSNYIKFILRFDHQQSFAPDYRLSDILANLEIKL